MQPLFRLISEIADERELASMVGVVAYSDAHPYYKAVFGDPDLTLALNELSKKRWILFASVPPPRPDPALVTALKQQATGLVTKAFHKLVGPLIDWIFKPDVDQSTFLGGSKSDAEAARIRSELGLEADDALPCLVLIFPEKADLASGLFEGYVQKYPLEAGTSKETAYNELQKWVKDVTTAVEDVDRDNQKRAEGVAAAVQFHLTNVRDLERVKKYLPLLPKIAGLVKKALGLG